MSTTSIIDSEGPISEGPINPELDTAKIGIPQGTISKNGKVFENPNLSGQTVTYEINDIDARETFSFPMDRNISSQEAPIGTWIGNYGAYRPPNYPPTLPDINGVFLGKYYWGNNNSKRHGQFVNYNIAEYHPDIARDCARTSNTSPQGKTTERNIGNGRTTDKCIISDVQVPWNNKTQFVEYGLHYPTYCQLGDFVLSDEDCKSQCKDETQKLNGGETYCDYALNRMCSIKKGDAYDKELINGELEYKISDKDYIKDEDRCIVYCGDSFYPADSTTRKCKESKRSICARKNNNWNLTDPSGMLAYCMSFWQTEGHLDIAGIENACGSKLSDPSSQENVFGNAGCANLCGASAFLDVDKQYCDEKRLDYCSQNDPITGEPLLFTSKCYDLCKEYPDECKTLLETKCTEEFEKEYPFFDPANDLDEEGDLTQEKYEEIETWLDTEKDGKKIRNYCGCFLPNNVYKGYYNKMEKIYNDAGFSFETDSKFVTRKPECMYPGCKRDAIQTSGQKQTDCGLCVQNILVDLDNSQVGKCLIVENAQKCLEDSQDDSLAVDPEYQEIYEKIREECNKETIIKIFTNANLAAVLGSLVGLALLVLLIVIIYKRYKK